MLPPANPLDAGWKSPFHVEGIQTSNFTSVSPGRFTVPSARQNAGRSAYDGPAPPRRPPCGGAKAPAATVTADATVIPGSVTVVNCSQAVGEAAAAAGGWGTTAAARETMAVRRTV